jgi:hypothetical protein
MRYTTLAAMLLAASLSSSALAADVGWDGTTFYRGDLEQPQSGSYSARTPQRRYPQQLQLQNQRPFYATGTYDYGRCSRR